MRPVRYPRYLESDLSDDENVVGVAGLTQGQVGLYYITAKVPALLAVPVLCGGDTTSNVIAKVSTARGVENIALCVAP